MAAVCQIINLLLYGTRFHSLRGNSVSAQRRSSGTAGGIKQGANNLPTYGTAQLSELRPGQFSSLPGVAYPNRPERPKAVRSERRFQRASFACGRYCSCFCVSVPFSRMPPPKQGKAKVATKKKSRPGGPRPGAGRPPIQPGRSAVKIRLDSEVISAVDTVAKLRKLDRSRVIEGALRQWLKEDKTAPGV